MNDYQKKAIIVLLQQIKNTVVMLEDLVLNTACEIPQFDTQKPAKSSKPTPAPDLDAEEEDSLEAALEKERLAIIESDKVLSDIWNQGHKINVK